MTSPAEQRFGSVQVEIMPKPEEVPGSWVAVLAAASKLGILGVFLRVVAAQLPDEVWLPNLVTWERDGLIVARVRHSCAPGCPLTAISCLTAFKVEESVIREKGYPYQVESVVPLNGDIEIWLGRVA